TDPYRLCSRAHCQVYAGAGAKPDGSAHAAPRMTDDPRAVAAVAATRGELLVREGGLLVDAVYSAACGGHTEDNDKAWGASPDPSLRGVLDVEEADLAAMARFDPVKEPGALLGTLPARPSCAGAASFRWSARVEAHAVEERAGVGRLRDLDVRERGVSGRVVALRIKGERGDKDIHGELEVRRVLGVLKSALF